MNISGWIRAEGSGDYDLIGDILSMFTKLN